MYFRTNTEDKIIVRGGYFIDCCCEGVSTGSYWEGIPCRAMLMPGSTCATGDYANLFKNRIYVKDDSFCAGTQYDICETQRFRLFLLEECTGTSPLNAILVEWNHPTTTGILQYNILAGVPTITIGTTGSISPYTNRSFAATGTVNDVMGQITNLSATYYDNNFVVNLIAGSTFVNTFPFRCIEPEQELLNLTGVTSGILVTKTPGIYFKYSGITDAYLQVNDLDVIAIENRLKSLLNSTFGLAASDAIVNTGYTAPFYTHFDLKLGCGNPFNKIEVDYALHGRSDPYPDRFQYGDDPAYSYYNPVAAGKNYFEWGTNTNCRWENSDLFGVYPTAYDAFVDCVPQVGGKVTYPQYNNPLISGYDRFANDFAERFGNLNSVIKYNNSCYSLSPSFFLMGMEGKLYKNYYYDKLKHVSPSTVNVSVPSGIMPVNCSYELFLPLFHADVPWGPFGSYCDGLENRTHLAWTYPYNTVENPETSGTPSVLSVDFPVPRVGFDYRPFAFMKTKGSWLRTEMIEMYAAIKAPVPYYVGDITGYDDLDQLLQIDPASCINGISVSGPTACSPVNISFPTSGKTIGQFVDAVNALRPYNYSGTKLFNFAIASDYVRDLPASIIVNVSSEIMDRNTLGYPQTPDGDEDYQSASSIVMPKAYPYYHGGSELNISWSPSLLPTQYYGSNTSRNAVAYVPPACTLLADRVPKDSFAGNIQNQNNMWWTAMPITIEDVVNIGINDPVFTSASVVVATGRMQLSVTGLFVASTGIPLDRGGAEFTAADLVNEINAIVFTNASIDYTPFLANTLLPYSYWIDDDTSETAGVYSYGTTNLTDYNYSYKEQLLDTSGTFTTSVLLKGLHRRRCNWTAPGFDPDQDPYLNYCIPPEATKIATENLDCDGDREVVLGYVLSQGCTSNNCITKWYIPTQRCPCDTVSRCSDGQPEELPHPYNQPINGINGETWAKAGWAGYTVSQPTLYICEYNFYPTCDIPLLVKVPFLVQAPDGTFFLQAGSDPSLPGYDDFCNSMSASLIIRSNLYGWCQYIDWSEQKVREEDIPRSNVPEAFIIGKACGALCSNKLWNYDPELTQVGYGDVTLADGPMYFTIPGGSIQPSDPRYATANQCPSFTCFSCDSWDKMCGIGIVFRDYTAYTSACALFRASISNATVDDLLGNGNLTRIDVDCSTACCESWFACDPVTNDGYYTKHVRHPWTQSVTYSYSYSYENQLGCDYSVSSDPGCVQLYSPSICIDDRLETCDVPPLYTNGKTTKTLTWDLTSNNTSCGCDKPDLKCVDEVVVDSPDCGYTDSLCSPCIVTLINPAPTPAMTVCGNCNNYPFPLPACENVSESSTSSTEGVNFCGTRPQWATYSESSTTLNKTCTSEFVDCDGAGSYDYSMTSSTTTNWYNANVSAIANGSITLNQSNDVTYTVANRVWTAAAPSVPTTVKTIPQLRDYWDNKLLVPGYANYNIVSSTGPFDSRVNGPVCTGV